MPRGPLVTKDMMGESCVLSWNEPEDNGGGAISHYVVEKKPVNGAK